VPDTQHDDGRRNHENATGRGGLEIKPGETVTLSPSGFHMMLVNLNHPLEAGQTVKATLKFDKAGTIDVVFPVMVHGASPQGGPAA
jgi:periplasmic copper chaperone A